MVEKKKRRFILKVNLILIIVFWLMLPMKVLAEGETPSEVPVVIEPVKDLQVQTTTDPITETAPMPEEIQPNAESTQQPQPEQTSETVLLEGSSIATENPQVQSSEVSDPTDTPESQNNVQLQPTEEPANTGQNNTIMEAVTALEESQAVLVDADGNPIPLATKEAVAALTAPDPQGCPPGVTPTWLGGTGAGCTVNYGSIQAAIDDSMVKDGWTIFIQAGTFIEEIDINKSITLKGSANLSTTIQSPDLLEEDFSTSTKKKSIIYVYGNANVTIDGLVIDGNNKGTNNDSFIGIAFHNAGGQVINNIIENIMDASFSGKQGDVGIFALNDDGVSRSLDVINNVIENFQKNGMALMGNGLTVNVEGNTVVGEGDTSVIAQNGIQVSDGATGKVKDNIIEDIYYTGGDWTASGILIDNTTTGTVEVQGNTLTHAQTGIDVANSKDGTVEVQSNNINVAYYGMRVTNSQGGTVEVQGNNITNAQNGMLVTNSQDGTVEVQSNNITDAQNGMWLANSQTGTLEVQDNTIKNGEWGVIMMNAEEPHSIKININHNRFQNNEVAVYSDNPEITVVGNIFEGNTYALDYDDHFGRAVILKAEYNYWGCDNGPNETCDHTTYTWGDVDYTPWLIDPDHDYVFDTSDGSGNFKDNCPHVANPDQQDSDHDGIGNACDSTPFGNPHEETIKSETIVVSEGQLIALSGSTSSTLILGNSSVAFGQPMGGYTASLSSPNLDALPSDIPGDYSFVSSLSINLLKGTETIQKLDRGNFTLRFKVPEEMEGKSFAILFWNVALGEYSELEDIVFVNGYIQVTVNTPGFFILVSK